MATAESKRVQAHRKQYFDRVSCLIEKGGNALIRVLAIREGVKKAEVIRRSILARAGLKMMPYPDALEKIADVQTQEEADKAIHRLQAHEMSSEIIEQVLEEFAPAEPDEARYQVPVDSDTRFALLKLAGFTEPEIYEVHQRKWLEGEMVTLTGYEIGNIRRMLANMQHIDNAEA